MNTYTAFINSWLVSSLANKNGLTSICRFRSLVAVLLPSLLSALPLIEFLQGPVLQLFVCVRLWAGAGSIFLRPRPSEPRFSPAERTVRSPSCVRIL